MRSLEIFSGAGGLAKGLELAGFQHAAFVEFNKHACATLRANFEADKVFEGDVRTFDFRGVGSVDLVAGGPPCQPFSLGGKHEAHDDTRDMFPAAAAAIEALAPSAFVFENVKGLLRASFADYFRYVLLRLTYPDATIRADQDWRSHLGMLSKLNFGNYEGLKYRVRHALIDAADYGIPQSRERVFIVGTRADTGVRWSFPQPTHSQNRLLWDKHVTGAYWQRHAIDLAQRENPSANIAARVRKYRDESGLFGEERKPWETIRDALAGVPHPLAPHEIRDHVFRSGARTYPGHTGSDIDEVAKTIKAGVHGVPGGENMIRDRDGSVRYLTVFEAKRLQTFPVDFMISGAWGEALRQIGNAVPVMLAKQLGQQLYSMLVTSTIPIGWADSPIAEAAHPA